MVKALGREYNPQSGERKRERKEEGRAREGKGVGLRLASRRQQSVQLGVHWRSRRQERQPPSAGKACLGMLLLRKVHLSQGGALIVGEHWTPGTV